MSITSKKLKIVGKALAIAAAGVIHLLFILFCLDAYLFVGEYGFVPISEFKLSDWIKRPVFWKSIEVPGNGFSCEEDVIEFVYSQLNLDSSFKLSQLRSNYDANGNFVGCWEVEFGKMVGSKPLLYYTNLNMDKRTIISCDRAYTNKSSFWESPELENIYEPFTDRLSMIYDLLESNDINKDDVKGFYRYYMGDYCFFVISLSNSKICKFSINMLTHEISAFKWH